MFARSVLAAIIVALTAVSFASLVIAVRMSISEETYYAVGRLPASSGTFLAVLFASVAALTLVLGVMMALQIVRGLEMSKGLRRGIVMCCIIHCGLIFVAFWADLSAVLVFGFPSFLFAPIVFYVAWVKE